MTAHTTLVLTWPHALTHLATTDDYLQVLREALRLSAARLGCVPVVCRVTPHQVWLMVQYQSAYETAALAEWIRAAARYAVTAYSATPPPWHTPCHVYMVHPDAVHREIVASMHDVIAPVVAHE